MPLALNTWISFEALLSCHSSVRGQSGRGAKGER